MEERPIQYVYPLEMPLKQKVEAIAKKIYRADGVNFSAAASKTLAELTELATATCRSASPRPSTVSAITPS